MSFTFFICRMRILVPFSQDYCKDLKVNYMAVLNTKSCAHSAMICIFNLNNNNFLKFLTLDFI